MKYAKIPEPKNYGNIATARLNMSKCKECLGCNLLYDELFEGKKECESFRSGIDNQKKKR
jgi:hypothetical protein